MRELRQSDDRSAGREGGAEPEGLDRYFAGLFTHSTDGVLLSRIDGSVVAANPTACRLLQRSAEEICRLGRAGLLVQEPAVERLLETRRRTGLAQGLLHFRLPDGGELAADCTSAILPTGDGRDALIVFRDLTQQRAAAQALEASEALHRLLFTMAPAGVLLVDGKGHIHAFNDRAAAQLGYGREEFARLRVQDVDLDGEEFVRQVGEALRDGPLEFETRHRHRTGEVREVLVKARPVEMRGQRLYLSVWEDLTERKRADEAQRLEALGRLAGGVAHDFNNLLTVVLSCAESLRGALASGGPIPAEAREDVEEIAASGARARDLVRHLLAFSRRQAVLPVLLDVNGLVRAGAELLRRLLGEDVELRLQLAPAVGAVRCDRAQMERVLVNLGVNARDAMPGGGCITLATDEVELGPEAARVAGLHAGRYVRLRVSDTGSGIPPDARGRVFEPFFTTKPVGSGTGLGLAIVHGVVRQHGGTVRFETAVGEGTTFEVLLPRASAATEEAVPEPEEPASAESGATVLVVEDEPAVRAVTERALRSGGYQVISAADGAEALARVVERQENGQGVDLLLTDAVMPGMDGLTLAEAVRARCPRVRVVVTTGHPEEVLVRRGLDRTRADVLLKPYAPGALLAHVRAVLARRVR